MANLEPSYSSDLQTASAVVYAKPAVLTGLQLNPAAADATLIIYDNASAASGRVLAKAFIKANASGQYIEMMPGIFAVNGLYASLTGAAAEYLVNFLAMGN